MKEVLEANLGATLKATPFCLTIATYSSTFCTEAICKHLGQRQSLFADNSTIGGNSLHQQVAVKVSPQLKLALQTEHCFALAISIQNMKISVQATGSKYNVPKTLYAVPKSI
jgi:hypothetical protein